MAAPPLPADPQPIAEQAPSGKQDRSWWPLAAAIAATIAIVSALAARRRRSRTHEIEPEAHAADPPPAPMVPRPSPPPRMLSPAPRPDAPPAEAPLRARLEIAYRPIRAGLNLISMTVEGELELVNDGAEEARDIRVGVRLLTARAGQDRDMEDARRAAIARPVVAAFALPPGERRRVRVVTAMPRQAIEPLIAAGRPMVVPVVAVNVLYDGGERQAAAAWAVGVERVDSVKLAPLWLDAEPRSFDAVAARPNGAVFTR